MTRLRGRTSAAVVLLGTAATLPSTPSVAEVAAVLRPTTLIEHSESHLRTTVQVDIVETLQGPRTADALASSEYGQVRVAVPDATGGELSLVAERFRLDDPNRYRLRFDRVLRSPLRVRGELLEDVELSRPRRKALVLRVLSIEPLELPPPVKVASVDELLANRARFDRRVIEIEGEHERGFEKSRLGGKIWLSFAPDAEIVNAPAGGPTPRGRNRVRVVGVLFAREGAHYGHLGGYPLMLVASRVEYL